MKPAGAIAASEQFGAVDCRKFRARIFAAHAPVAPLLAAGYLRRVRRAGDSVAGRERGNRDGNIWLRGADEALRIGRAGLSAVMDDSEVCDMAEAMARQCERAYSEALSRGGEFVPAVDRVRAIVEGAGVVWPHQPRKSDAPEQLRDKLAGAVARAGDPVWWRRQLRKACGRRVEAVMRDAGAVRRSVSPYVSPWALARYLAAQRRNAAILSRMDAESDQGDVVPLELCVEASVANPTNRRNELMTRMRGWEEIAAAMGLMGSMLTLTAPSAYHPWRAGGGLNPKYNGADPREVMDYLCTVWANIRAEWHRAGIRAFGFRMAEPHHDGTPHCHFLLFFSPADIEQAWSIFRSHALAEAADEKGAEQYRCDRLDIDPAKGTAAGYVAKYVAKNIDGFGLGADEHDEEGQVLASEGAARVRAWASLWGIRQFQQIGAISVTVWRELRRLAGPMEWWEPVKAEQVRKAADAGDWAAFVEAMGGAFVRRQKSVVQEKAQEVIRDPWAAVPKRMRGRIDTARARMLEVKSEAARARWAERVRQIEHEVAIEAERRRRKACVVDACYDADGVAALGVCRELAKLPGRYGDDVLKILGVVMRAAVRTIETIQTREKVWKVVRRAAAHQAGASPPLDLCH